LGCFITGIIALVLAILGSGLSGFASLLSISLGETNSRTLLKWNLPRSGTSAIFLNSIAANVPQIGLSIIYLMINALFTAMFVGLEWSRFAFNKKGLRVSGKARGNQRSTYFLQLPYRFGVPLAAISTALHLLVSQSIFIVSIEVYTASGERRTNLDFITCGYSPIAILLFVVAFVILFIYLYCIADRKTDLGIPVAGHCSLVISAACHPDVNLEKVGMSIAPIQWGVTRQPEGGQPGHCSFSSGRVELPEKESLYRGEKLTRI
jgi:hypothetical protein